MKHFWDPWRKDYVVSLRENLRYIKNPPLPNDVVIVHDDKLPRQQWVLGEIIELLLGSNGRVRDAKVKLGRTLSVTL